MLDLNEFVSIREHAATAGIRVINADQAEKYKELFLPNQELSKSESTHKERIALYLFNNNNRHMYMPEFLHLVPKDRGNKRNRAQTSTTLSLMKEDGLLEKHGGTSWKYDANCAGWRLTAKGRSYCYDLINR